VGQRASLPTQRQGSALGILKRKVKQIIDRLKPDLFEEHHREALLTSFPEGERASIDLLLDSLRKFPLAVFLDKQKPSVITLPLFQPVMFGEVEQLYQTALKFSERLNIRLNELELPASCFGIQQDERSGQLSLRIDLKDQTSEQIQSILTHLPAIIQGLQ
jgi:hypothetical protein